MTKFPGNPIPKSIPKKYRERIMYWDDERNIGNGIIVSLEDGWRDGTDLAVCHTLAEDMVKEMLWKLQSTEPCDCEECRAELAAKKKAA